MFVAKTAISAHTGLVCLLGHPVRHSLSPRMHNAAFAHQSIDLVYVAFDVPSQYLKRVIEGLAALGFRGANLTIPHKEAVIPLLDDVDPVAEKAGAVNTIVNDEGRLTGHNTDVAGFGAALRTLLPHGARGLRCLLVGAGGAGRAAATALAQDEPAHLWVFNRTYDRAERLCESLSRWSGVPHEAGDLRRVREVAPQADLIVNATSLGLREPVKDFVLDVDTLHEGQVLFDLVYSAESTTLVKAARARGISAIDGKEMLVMQAAGSYRLWTDQEAPVEVMRESIDKCEE